MCVLDQMMAAAAAKHEIVSDLFQVNGSAAACFLAAAVAAFLGASTFLCSWLFGFWNSGETDRLRAMSSISGPGMNAFSWGRGCKGKLKNKEIGVFASFSSTVTPVVQVSSFGILAARLPSFTTTSGMPSLRVQRTCSKQQLYLVPVGPSWKNWKLSSLVKTSSSSSRGSEVLRLRLSGEEVMLHWARLRGSRIWLLVSWVWMKMPWLEGGLWTTRSPWVVLVSRRTAPRPSHGFVVGLVRTCLGSGRARIASRNVAGRCE